MAEKVKNPHGKKGKHEHQSAVQKLLQEVATTLHQVYGKLTAKKEYPIATPKGKKNLRLVDVAGVIDDPENEYKEIAVRLIQVGVTDAEGNPVAREQEAIEDIEAVAGVKVEFYDYENQTMLS